MVVLILCQCLLIPQLLLSKLHQAVVGEVQSSRETALAAVKKEQRATALVTELTAMIKEQKAKISELNRNKEEMVVNLKVGHIYIVSYGQACTSIHPLHNYCCACNYGDCFSILPSILQVLMLKVFQRTISFILEWVEHKTLTIPL